MNTLDEGALKAKKAYPWLPTTYSERELLKNKAGYVRSDAERLLHIMQSHFARSLESCNYDTKQHPGWQEYASAYLASESSEDSTDTAIGAVADLLGIVPVPSAFLPPGQSNFGSQS